MLVIFFASNVEQVRSRELLSTVMCYLLIFFIGLMEQKVFLRNLLSKSVINWHGTAWTDPIQSDPTRPDPTWSLEAPTTHEPYNNCVIYTHYAKFQPHWHIQNANVLHISYVRGTRGLRRFTCIRRFIISTSQNCTN